MAEKILDEDLPVEINGEIVVFEKGMTQSEVRDRYQSLTGGFVSSLSSGVERLKGSLGAIPETFLGDVFSSQELLDEAGEEYRAAREAVSEALPAPVTYKDVTEAYEREGLTGAIPDAYRFSVESIGQNLPYVAPAMVANKVASTELGLGVASYLSKAVPFLRTAAVRLPPSVAKAGLGVAAGVGTLALQFFGDNLQRQYEVAQGDDPEAQVTPDQINSFTSALAAGPQAAMDYVVIALTGGIGRGPQIAAARSLKESLAAVGTTAKAATSPTLAGAARASFAESALEFPTELAQTVLERAQAGLSISPQDAEFVEEMIATVAGTIPMTGAFGSYGTVRSYRANKKAYDNWEKLSDQEKVIRNDYENRRQQSLQSEYDNSVRIYSDNVKEVQNKINEAGRESVENRRLIEQGVQEAKDAVELTVDDVVDAADSRNIKTDDQAFKNFVYRTTGGQTSDINEADQDALRAMRTILTGFTVQNYYDADTEEGVSVPSFTSEELESVITGFKGGAKLTPESVRRKLHEKFYSKAKGRDQLVDFTDSESSNSIASSIIEEMKMRGYAVKDKNGNVKARKPKYTETQYRDLMEKAYRDGSINLRDYEQITGRFGEKNFQSFIDDAIIRGDMPSVQSRPMQRRGEFAPLVFRATLSEDAAQTGGDLAPITDKNGRPVIKATPDQKGGIKKRVTAGNVVTEVVEANGYFVRDGNGEIVGGATSREEAAKEAKFLNENQSNYFITDQATGNITYGSKKKLDKIIKDSKGIPEYLRNAARAPDYTGVRPKLIRGAYSTDRNKSQGFAVRQFLSPGLAVKDKQTGRLENTGETFGARRPSVTELSFAPDLQTASSVELEFAKETMPGAANWDKKVDEVGKQKRAELQELFEEEGRLFRPPSMAEIFADSDIQRPQKPSRISKREKVISEIKEYPVERGQEVLDIIENKLKEANLDKALIATVKDKIGRDGVTAEGSYSPNDDGFRRIAISLDQIKDAKTSEEVRIAVAGIMDHEIIHAMRDLDLFTMQEWNVLSNATYRVRNKDGQTFFERAAIDYEGQGDTNYILEEAVAEMYRQYYSVPEVRRQIAGQPRTLLERIAVFMEKMYNAMSGAGFVTSADVISSMKMIQAREAGEVRTIQGQRNRELGQGRPAPVEDDTDDRSSVYDNFSIVDVRLDDGNNYPDRIIANKIDVSKLKRLPGGTTRDAYIVGDKVIKVAKNPRGLQQNASIGYGDSSILGSSIPELFETGKDYIVTENVPRNDKELRKFLKPLKEFSAKDFENKTASLQDAMSGMGLDGFLNYDLLWDDFTSFRNWGQRSNGDFVLIDEGALNKDVTATSRIPDWAKSEWEEIKRDRRKAKKSGPDAVAGELTPSPDLEIESDERLSAVPLAPGTAPIPEGHVRFFHYTYADPDTIRRTGIDVSFAKGETYGEPNQIWATKQPPEKIIKTHVEFSLPYDDPRIGGTIRSGDVRSRTESQATFIGSIRPEELIAIHEPWHDQYRHIINNPRLTNEVLDGKHDRLLGKETPVSRAVSEVKNLARVEGDSLSSLENASDERLARVMDRVDPYEYEVSDSNPNEFIANFVSESGSRFEFFASNGGSIRWTVDFRDLDDRDKKSLLGYGDTGKEGIGALRVLKTVHNLLREVAESKNPEQLSIFASRLNRKGEKSTSRARIYRRAMKDVGKDFGYAVEETVRDKESFFLAKKGEYSYTVQDESGVGSGERMSVAPSPTLTQGSPQSQWRIPSVNPVSRMDFTSRAVKDFNDERLAIAYHGSPANFDKFDINFLNTGEGAQAFGWGLYFTDLLSIGRFYANTLSKITYKGEESVKYNPLEDQFTSFDIADSAVEKSKRISSFDNRDFTEAQRSTIREAIKNQIIRASLSDLREKASADRDILNIDDWYSNRFFEIATSISDGIFRGIKNVGIASDYFVGGKEKSENIRNNAARLVSEEFSSARDSISKDDFNIESQLYEVEIPDRKDLWDWDAKLRDQPYFYEKIKGPLDRIIRRTKGMKVYRTPEEVRLRQRGELPDVSPYALELTGREAYELLKRQLGSSDRLASEFLAEQGYKGHYYNAASLTPGFDPKAKNYVIYDDEAISIVKKLYQDKRPALDRDPDLSKRSEEIINGTRTGERLSVSNQSKVKKKEPRAQRNMEQLRNIFPARNEETFFETFNKTLFQPDRDQLKKFLTRMRMKFIDQYTYLQKISEAAALKMKDNRDIRAATNAASLAYLSDRTNSVVAGAINEGAVSFRGGIIRVDHTKKSLKQALEPLFKADDDLYRDWGMWMVANRAQRIIKDGKLTPLSKTEIKTINEDIKRRNLLPMFEQVKSDYEEWNDSLVDVMKATGIINEELARVFKKYGDYIPFYRNMDMDAEGIEGVSPEVFKQILAAEGVDLSLGANRRLRSLFPTLTDQRPPKKMKGGDQQLVDPLTGIMQNLRAAVMAGSKNLAAQRVMIDAVDAGFATKVEPDSKGNVPAGAFTVRVNGEENYFTTNDDLLIETLMGFTQGKVNIHPFFSGPANLLRETVARSPLFLLRNPLRDSVAVWTTSGANMTPVIDTMKRFANEIGEKSEEYKTLRGAGVVGGYDYVFEPKKFEKSFRDKMRREGMTTKKNSAEIVTEPFRKVWDKLGDISQASDAATRLEIYEDTLQNLLNKGVDRAEAETEAIFQAMETLNFSRRGNSAVLSYFMPALPFFNARIQGLDVMYRSLRGQYKSNRDGEVKAMNSFLARGGQIAAASIAYAMLSQDDEEYKAASQAERDENWIIGGVKIPTPFEIGFVFKTIPERLYRALVTGDDTFNEGYDAFKRGLVNAFEIPLAGPQAFAPAVEVVFNHSLYTGRPVVPQYMEDRPPALQYKYYTSEFSRVIGETFNVSPLQVEHVINGYTGTIGSYILGVADFTSSIARGKPVMLNWRSDELPIIGSLFQSAEASGGQQQVWNDFYFSVRGIGAALNAARNEPELQKDIMERYSDVLAVKPRIEKINTRINNLRAQRKNVLLSRQLSDDQKRAMLDSIDKSIKDIIASTSSLRSLEPGPIPFFRDIN